MNVHDAIYLYDPQDREYKATVREVFTKAKGRVRVTTRVKAVIVSPKFKGDSLVVIQNEVIQRPDWAWSIRPFPAIRKNAIVHISHGDELILQCKVLGLIPGIRSWEDDFVYEGVKVVSNPRKFSYGGFRGHRFTAATSEVTQILEQGSGRRLLRGPYLTKSEERTLFAELHKAV